MPAGASVVLGRIRYGDHLQLLPCLAPFRHRCGSSVLIRHKTIEIFSSGEEHYRFVAAAPDDMFERYAHDLDEAFRSVKFPGLHVSAADLPEEKK